MERGTLKSIGASLKKLKYPALILLLGVVLLLWPSKEKREEVPPEPVTVQEPDVQAQMEAVLSCIDGAGQVRVLLTKQSGDENVYQTDSSESHDADGSADSTVSTVFSGGDELPVVRKIVYGEYRGAVVVCEGAERASVRLALVNAVAGLTGLSADRITVIKMKS